MTLGPFEPRRAGGAVTPGWDTGSFGPTGDRRHTTMAQPATDAETEPVERYASFETSDGQVVLYDREDPTSWLQTDTLVAIEH